MNDKCTCSNCFFFKTAKSTDAWGRCHKNPPAVTPDSTFDRWPECCENEFCGGWRPDFD